MPHHGNEEEHSSSRDQGSKRDEPVIRDHRKVDPVTGQARHPEGGTTAEPTMDAADSDGDALAQAEEILNRVEVPAEESVAQGVPAGSTTGAEAAELKNDLLRLQAEYVNYRKRVERDRAVAGEMAVIGVLNSHR
ncbi:MAG: nucleotide exchange factor GrpE [Arthrobacter sp.]|nr:nucleotide exchange factor GrpE [Arthrobacter sp.]